MIVDGVIILCTAAPDSPHMRAYVRRLEATGLQVFLQPLSALKQEKKPRVAPTVHQSLARVHPN